ncbi:Regulator of gene activity [Taenia solium]|eukprot:TsM_000660700 transcript=TsM_000660700 gene=TsM_000660700
MEQSQNPGLTGRSSISAKGGSNAGTTRRSYSAVASSSIPSTSYVQHTSGLSMDEEFPPLPQASGSTSTVADSAASRRWGPCGGPSSSSATTKLSSTTTSTESPNITSEESLRRIWARSPSGPPIRGPSPRGSISHPSGNSPTILPNDMIDNQYGMLGLLRLTETDSSLRIYAPGFNLASIDTEQWPPPGELHRSFSGPLGNPFMLGPQDMEHAVLPEYLVSRQIGNRLPRDPPLERLGNPTLFWIFYNFCSEEVQLVVAKELYNRGWRYHKIMKRWLKPLPGNEAIPGGEARHGYYYCWDPSECQAEVKQMQIYDTDLDDTPTTYQLSSRTLNARVQFMSPRSQQQRHQ